MRRLKYIALLLVLLGPSRAAANEGEGGASIFVRGDTDETVVVSPRVSAAVTLDDERTSIRAAYAADIWTSASIDIRTAATAPVTEQRDEINLAVQHELDDVTIGGSYYYSGENDYWSHGFALRSVQELFGNATTLEESLRYSHDIVGRAGDPNFERPLDSFSLRAVLTQIVTADVIVQGVWEGTYRTGYQSSPYRFVGLGGVNDGTCADITTVLCLPEAHPNSRIRSAFVLRGRFALAREGQRTLTSAGLGYRFYIDDWGIRSHTGIVQIAWAPAEDQIFTVRYRFYTQTGAGFYSSAYDVPGPTAQINFITRDRELSPMFSNRVALSYQGRAAIAEGVAMKIAVAVGGSLFAYADFAGLDEVYGLDGTVAFTLEL